MSLFQVKEWWSTKVGTGEMFDVGCLCIGDISNYHKKKDKIIIGGFDGVLRIYEPRKAQIQEGEENEEIQTLLLEMILSDAILQVEVGNFSALTDKVSLAVLHPRLLTIYSFSVIEGEVDYGTQYQLNVLFEHRLQRSAFNFCYGPFNGASDGKDLICVQSLDATLTFYEQDSFGFTRFLPGSVLPGPLIFVSSNNSFATVSSSRCLESYKYQTFASAADSQTKEEAENVKAGKRVVADWSYNLGEDSLHLHVQCVNNSSASILVLGERSLFCVSDTGVLTFMVKLDFGTISSLLSYQSPNNCKVNYILGTESGNLMIFQNEVLKWSAKMHSPPVQLRIGNFHDIEGGIVALCEDGSAGVFYLGTDPQIFVSPTFGKREIDYELMDKEMKVLQERAREKRNEAYVPKAVEKNDEIDISVSIGQISNQSVTDLNLKCEMKTSDTIFPLEVKLLLKVSYVLKNVRVSLSIPSPICADKNSVHIPQIEPSLPAELILHFYQGKHGIISDLNVIIVASFTEAEGVARFSQATFKLPLSLAVKPAMPMKNAANKVTFETNLPPANLIILFSDILPDSPIVGGTSIAFQYHTGQVTSILAAKQSNRYRIQSKDIEAIALILTELLQRIHNHHPGKANGVKFSISPDQFMTLDPFINLIKNHIQLRENAKQMEVSLDMLATQFRALQRRLLMRFKDKTPTSLQNLDTLLEETFGQIFLMTNEYERNAEELFSVQCALNATSRLFCVSLKLAFDLNSQEMKVVENAMNFGQTDVSETGWEESVDASLIYLLRNIWTKSTKDVSLNPAPMEMPKDASKLKKHLNLVFDKLSRGTRMTLDAKDSVKSIKQARLILPDGLPPTQPRYEKMKGKDSENDTNNKHNYEVVNDSHEKNLKSGSLPVIEESVSGKDSWKPPTSLTDLRTLPSFAKPKIPIVEEVPDLDDM